MKDHNKDSHLQIRVSSGEKAIIARAARRAGMTMSTWMLAKALPPQEIKFRQLVEMLGDDEHNRYAYAGLNDLLVDLSPAMFSRVVEESPVSTLTPYAGNYLAAMVELAASRKGVAPPPWTGQVGALDKPHFGADLGSLRLYLLTHSPPPFRRRNIFIDATLGDRV